MKTFKVKPSKKLVTDSRSGKKLTIQKRPSRQLSKSPATFKGNQTLKDTKLKVRLTSNQGETNNMDIEIMQQKIQAMACPSLINRIQYYRENVEMRRALRQIQDFANYEKKIEAVEYMSQLYERRTLFECLMKWVLVVYDKELK